MPQIKFVHRRTQTCHAVTYYPWYTLFTAIIRTILYSTAILSLRVCSVTLTSSIGYRRLSQVETNTDLDRPPSEEEVKKAIKQLSTGKAPGADAIPGEVYKHGGDTLSTTEVDSPFLSYVG